MMGSNDGNALDKINMLGNLKEVRKGIKREK